MIYLRFAGAAAALVWGLCTAFRPRVPLYYKIVSVSYTHLTLPTT